MTLSFPLKEYEDRFLFGPFNAQDVDPVSAKIGVRSHHYLTAILLQLLDALRIYRSEIITVPDSEGKNVYLNGRSLRKWIARHENGFSPLKSLVEQINDICTTHYGKRVLFQGRRFLRRAPFRRERAARLALEARNAMRLQAALTRRVFLVAGHHGALPNNYLRAHPDLLNQFQNIRFTAPAFIYDANDPINMNYWFNFALRIEATINRNSPTVISEQSRIQGIVAETLSYPIDLGERRNFALFYRDAAPLYAAGRNVYDIHRSVENYPDDVVLRENIENLFRALILSKRLQSLSRELEGEITAYLNPGDPIYGDVRIALGKPINDAFASVERDVASLAASYREKIAALEAA